jgi:hypothetical protein
MFLVLSGCTSLKPIELSPEQLQNRIATEDIVKVGEIVKVVTSDGKTREFKVTEIREDHILGKDVDIPIKDIIALETREFSGGKTVALVGGTTLGTMVIIILILSAMGPIGIAI